MPVSGEVDGAEWDISQQARRCSFVETEETELTDDVDGTSGSGTFCLRRLSLNLKTNLTVSEQSLVTGVGGNRHLGTYTISRGFVKT